jgi:hypothetical protein
MWGGGLGGLVDSFTDDAELKKFFKGRGTEDQINKTIERLKEKTTWDLFEKDYPFGDLINYNYFKHDIMKKDEDRLQKIKAESESKKKKVEDIIKEMIKNGTIIELTDEEYKKYLQSSPPVYEKRDIGFLNKNRWMRLPNGMWVHATPTVRRRIGLDPAEMGW